MPSKFNDRLRQLKAELDAERTSAQGKLEADESLETEYVDEWVAGYRRWAKKAKGNGKGKQ